MVSCAQDAGVCMWCVCVCVCVVCVWCACGVCVWCACGVHVACICVCVCVCICVCICACVCVCVLVWVCVWMCPPLESREPRNLVLSKFCSKTGSKYILTIIASAHGTIDHLKCLKSQGSLLFPGSFIV
jgi:hypothetical protein